MGLKLKSRDEAWLKAHQRYVPCPACKIPMDLTNNPYGVGYVCRPCGVRHGAHQSTGEPLGTPAPDEDTRRARIDAHEALDALWDHPDAVVTRDAAYAYLASRMNMHPSECHIGRFDVEQCHKAIRICEDLR